MLKIRSLIAAAGVAAMLAGCAPGTNVLDPSALTQLATFTQEVVSITEGAGKFGCAVAPTALTVAGILSSNPAITTAAQVAAAICPVVNKAGAGRHAAAWRRMHKAVRVGTYRGPLRSVPVVVVPR